VATDCPAVVRKVAAAAAAVRTGKAVGRVMVVAQIVEVDFVEMAMESP
jgi:hypothetical protein